MRAKLFFKTENRPSVLTPIKLSADDSSVIDPVVARALEALSITAVSRALDALSRNSAKDLASTSMHCDCYEGAVIISNCVVDEYRWHLATSRMDVTSMISNDVMNEPRSVSSNGMKVLAMHTNSCGRRCSGKLSPFSILGTDKVALEPAR